MVFGDVERILGNACGPGTPARGLRVTEKQASIFRLEARSVTGLLDENHKGRYPAGTLSFALIFAGSCRGCRFHRQPHVSLGFQGGIDDVRRS